jgi:hypothetical protein
VDRTPLMGYEDYMNKNTFNHNSCNYAMSFFTIGFVQMILLKWKSQRKKISMVEWKESSIIKESNGMSFLIGFSDLEAIRDHFTD